MFRVGQRVKVSPRFTMKKHPRTGKKRRAYETDGTWNEDFRNKEGTVIDLETEDCGATKESPLYLVWVKGLGKDGFWEEELRAA